MIVKLESNIVLKAFTLHPINNCVIQETCGLVESTFTLMIFLFNLLGWVELESSFNLSKESIKFWKRKMRIRGLFLALRIEIGN